MKPDIDLPYFPRQKLLADTLKVFTSGLKQGVTLFAPRRQGKTMFVHNELIPAVREGGWQAHYIDLWKRRDEPELAVVEALENAAAGKSLPRRARMKVERVKARLKVPSVAELGVDAVPDGPSATDALETRLARSVERLMYGKDTVLLVFDEFQALAGGRRSDFVAALRANIQAHQRRLKVFYTGSSRDALNSMFNRQHAPLFGSAMPLSLPDLPRAFSEDRAVFLSDRTGLAVDVDALDRAFTRLGRTPEFLNDIVLRMMINGVADIGRAIDEWLAAQRESGVGSVLEGLKPLQRAMLEIIASDNHPPIFSKQVLEVAGKMVGEQLNSGRIQTAVSQLCRMHLVSPTGEQAGAYEVDDRALLIFLREARKPTVDLRGPAP